jgi:CheY-like chemotaxis protein
MATPLCILLVDDSRFFLNIERQFLRSTPASIIEADNSVAALALAQEFRPSLIFMNSALPETDGFECCLELKQDPGLNKIPVVLIGDSTNDEHRIRAEESGCDAYLTKPLDRRQFLETGHRFLYSVERREPRKIIRISVLFTWRGEEQMGQCMDMSSGGMFLATPPFADKDEVLMLHFTLPDEVKTKITLKGRVAWPNIPEREIKTEYPPGYGIEFLDIPEEVGIALRHCFGE